MDKLTRREFLIRGASFGLAAGLGILTTSKCMKHLVTPTHADKLDLAVAKGGDPASNTIKAIQALGGIERFVSKGDKVVVKPNPITPSPPEVAANTNYMVVGTVVKMCVQAGAREVVVTSHDQQRSFEGNGIMEASLNAGARVVPATTRDLYQRVPVVRGRVLQHVEIIKEILDADVFINIPIAKNHAGAIVTVSMKNLMGINWDRNYFHENGLHQPIADLNTVIKQDLIIVDANRVLLSGGPSGPGQTREDKTVIAGTDPVAIDAFTTELLNRNPDDIAHIQYAYELGIGEVNLKKLNIKEIAVN